MSLKPSPEFNRSNRPSMNYTHNHKMYKECKRKGLTKVCICVFVFVCTCLKSCSWIAFWRNSLMALDRWFTKVSSLNVIGSPYICRKTTVTVVYDTKRLNILNSAPILTSGVVVVFGYCYYLEMWANTWLLVCHLRAVWFPGCEKPRWNVNLIIKNRIVTQGWLLKLPKSEHNSSHFSLPQQAIFSILPEINEKHAKLCCYVWCHMSTKSCWSHPL